MPDFIGFEKTTNRKFLSQTQAAIGIGKCRWTSDFIGILKPQIGNSWVRHKQLSESENSDSDIGKKISDDNLEMLPKFASETM